ncbi:hypothetical protein [Cellulosilyticum ruminicola]|nr:hypothetical protein [Cellulosilyticum ruminicola]
MKQYQEPKDKLKLNGIQKLGILVAGILSIAIVICIGILVVI